MGIRADSNFRAGDWAKFEAIIVPKLIKAVTAATDSVFQETQNRVPVRTGNLRSSGSQIVTWEGQRITGTIQYSAPYSVFVEYGVGQKGAAGEWSGPFAYGPMNGFAGFGFVRGSLDSKRLEIIRSFEDAGLIAA